MRHNNNSSNSLGSNKDKDLPPVPMKDSIDNDNDIDTLLQSKSLGRKNFKKLSLNASPVKEKDTIIDATYDVKSLRARRQRPPPTLNLRERPISGSLDPGLRKSIAVQESDKQIINRRRQTVISSISPIKSPSSLPLELKMNGSATSIVSTSSLSKPTTPKSSKPTTPQQLHIQALSIHSPSSTSSLKIKDNEDLMVLKELGSGNSGTVSKVVHLPTQTTMAKKIIPIDSNNAVQTQIIRELRILHECRSPYIIEFFGAFINNNSIVICMEYCNCGSLDKIVPFCQPRQFPTNVLKKLAFSILTGLNYLYVSHKILHRDIKPSNVLMTHKGEFKLCDFGVSRQLTNSLTQADTFVGTSMYMSPERIQGMNYGIKSDVWSMGLLLIEMASGLPIWRDDDDDEGSSGLFQGPEGILDLLQRIVNETPPSLSKKVNPTTKKPYDYHLCKFIESCLAKDLSERKAPDQFLADKSGFLKGVEDGIYDKDVRNWAKAIRKAITSKPDK